MNDYTTDVDVQGQVQKALKELFADERQDFFAALTLAIWARTALISQDAIRAELERLLIVEEAVDPAEERIQLSELYAQTELKLKEPVSDDPYQQAANKTGLSREEVKCLVYQTIYGVVK